MIPVVLVFSLALPLFLIPIEEMLPYPHIIEEVVKLGILLVLSSSSSRGEKSKHVLSYALFAALLFSLSESMLYLFNFFILQTFGLFFLRLFLTSVLHLVTMGIMYFSGRKVSYGYVIGLLLAIALHYWYNVWVGGLHF